MHGWLVSNQLNTDAVKVSGDFEQCRGYVRYAKCLNKFPKDCVAVEKGNQNYFLDGYVSNKSELNRKYHQTDWQNTFTSVDTEMLLKELRGGFCGYRYDALKQEFMVFTDQVSNKAVYYYVDDTYVILSDDVNLIAKTMRNSGIDMEINDRAVSYMLTYAYMMDDSTFIKGVKRVMPGQYVKIGGGKAEIFTYYQIDNTKIQNLSETEAVELLDETFRNAIRREFEKDKEYGYRHLVDLSGGLDSRMVCMVAHEMGYTDQLNFTYCRPGYLDQKISEQIASDLKHEYLFRSLDDIKWMYDIDEIVGKNNGAALFCGITGGNRFLKSIDTSEYGIEHTGMIGDAIVSTFYKDETFNYSVPKWGYNRYSGKLSVDFDDAALERYPNQEVCAVYTRGILGAQSSYIIRQHYLETASPFMDVDFLNVCFSIPFSYRKNHHIYLKWIQKKYPQVAEYGWEKWGGVKPKENCIFFRKVVTARRLFYQVWIKITGRKSKDSMNPLDYWYSQNQDVQKYYQEYFEEHILHPVLTEDTRKNLKLMFATGSVSEKAMALTVLAAATLYFEK